VPAVVVPAGANSPHSFAETWSGVLGVNRRQCHGRVHKNLFSFGERCVGSEGQALALIVLRDEFELHRGF
jgi:hypothetical protein